MVKFVDDLYVTDAIKPKVGSIKWKTISGIGMISVYFITISLGENDLFDIYSASMFKQRGLRRSRLVILGLAESYESATYLVERMIKECIERTGDIHSIRSYYLDYIAKHT